MTSAAADDNDNRLLCCPKYCVSVSALCQVLLPRSGPRGLAQTARSCGSLQLPAPNLVCSAFCGPFPFSFAFFLSVLLLIVFLPRASAASFVGVRFFACVWSCHCHCHVTRRFASNSHSQLSIVNSNSPILTHHCTHALRPPCVARCTATYHRTDPQPSQSSRPHGT